MIGGGHIWAVAASRNCLKFRIRHQHQCSSITNGPKLTVRVPRDLYRLCKVGFASYRLLWRIAIMFHKMHCRAFKTIDILQLLISMDGLTGGGGELECPTAVGWRRSDSATGRSSFVEGAAACASAYPSFKSRSSRCCCCLDRSKVKGVAQTNTAPWWLNQQPWHWLYS